MSSRAGRVAPGRGISPRHLLLSLPLLLSTNNYQLTIIPDVILSEGGLPRFHVRASARPARETWAEDLSQHGNVRNYAGFPLPEGRASISSRAAAYRQAASNSPSAAGLWTGTGERRARSRDRRNRMQKINVPMANSNPRCTSAIWRHCARIPAGVPAKMMRS